MVKSLTKRSIESILLGLFGLLWILGEGCGCVSNADEMQYCIGLAYANSLKDVISIYRDNAVQQGEKRDNFPTIPIGVTAGALYPLGRGFAIESGFGPLMLYFGNDDYFTNLPVHAGIRYILFADKKITPYLRADIRYNLAIGDYVASSRPGFFGGGGLSFHYQDNTWIELEMLMDYSTVTLDKWVSPTATHRVDARPSEYLICFSARFSLFQLPVK